MNIVVFLKGYVMRKGDVQLSPGTACFAAMLLLLGPPLLSGWLAGFPAGFAELPPRTAYILPPALSAILFALFLGTTIAAAIFLLRPGYFGFDHRAGSDFTAFEWSFVPQPGGRFPLLD